MKITHPILQKPLDFVEGEVLNLIIESQILFSQMVEELYSQCNGEAGRYILSEEDDIIRIDKSMQLIIDYYTIDINNRKIVSALYNLLNQIVIEDKFLETQEVLMTINSYLTKLIEESDYPLIFEKEMDAVALFKLADLKLESDYSSLVERLVDYIMVVNQILKVKCFVLVNAKTFFSKSELERFYKWAAYYKIAILVISNSDSEPCSPMEKKYIIDVDMCQIY